MAKTVEVEFEIGEQVVSKNTLIGRARGEINTPVDKSEMIIEIQLSNDRTKYRVDGRWYFSNEIVRKEDARKFALNYLVGRIEHISNQV